ncbi:MAG: HYR domain-containing protein [Bacteroidales bacterium]|nr:HYR domain-containing protein [Bacteroidales bacterium]MBN2821033.1 HYR domain-containing protein [Bacteroidales bacterium]
MKYLRILALIGTIYLQNLGYSQTINIHSVSSARQMGGMDHGYTLDGSHMVLSRFKLLNPENFSDTGTYPKNINIFNSYYTSGSLEQITSVDGIDIFFFGWFITTDPSFVPFTESEVDSLYEWSKRGGKMIIAEQVDSDRTFENLGYKWGYEMRRYDFGAAVALELTPTDFGKTTKLYNGPFGEVTNVTQGGMAQGYFNGLTDNVVILATDRYNKPTLFVDCTTLDLICADTDVFTELGGLSIGQNIVNDQDRFWANAIAFMDSMSIEAPEVDVQYDGTSLSSGEFSSYQWFYNFDTIEGATTSTLTPDADGYYRLVVKNEVGCTDTSDLFLNGNITNPVIECPGDIVSSTLSRLPYARVSVSAPKVLDGYGIDTIIANIPDTFWVGEYNINWEIINNAGYSSTCMQHVSVLDIEPPFLKCGPDIQLNTEPGKPYAVDSLTQPYSRDNVYVDFLAKNTSDTFQIGITEVVWTAIDTSGNSAQCSQLVFVSDKEAPEIYCPDDIYVNTLYGENYTTVSLDTPTVYDNNGNVFVSNNSNGLFPVGTTYVTWTATDKYGNKATCEQAVTVIETIELKIPNIITPNGDGMNDYLVIDGLPELTELVVFNDKNQILYKTDNYQNNWDGRDNNGNPIHSGTYWYSLTVLQNEQYSGFIVLKRE